MTTVPYGPYRLPHCDSLTTATSKLRLDELPAARSRHRLSWPLESGGQLTDISEQIRLPPVHLAMPQRPPKIRIRISSSVVSSSDRWTLDNSCGSLAVRSSLLQHITSLVETCQSPVSVRPSDHPQSICITAAVSLTRSRPAQLDAPSSSVDLVTPILLASFLPPRAQRSRLRPRAATPAKALVAQLQPKVSNAFHLDIMMSPNLPPPLPHRLLGLRRHPRQQVGFALDSSRRIEEPRPRQGHHLSTRRHRLEQA